MSRIINGEGWMEAGFESVFDNWCFHNACRAAKVYYDGKSI